MIDRLSISNLKTVNKMHDGGTDQAFLRSSLKGTQLENTFAGALSFMRRKYTRDLAGVDVAITGIPYDCAVSHRPGTRFGPASIRRASAHFATGPIWPWGFDPFDRLAAIDYGDCAIDYSVPSTVDKDIEEHVRPIVESGAYLLSLGGDHYTTYPVLKAVAAKYGPLAFVQFDAHRDVEPANERILDHGAMFGYAIEDGLIDPKKSVQIGIRTTFEGEEDYGMNILHADKVHDSSPEEIARIVHEIVGDSKTYLTFDIDCLDPAFAPGTGTPVPGGLSSHQALSILRQLKGVDFVASDLVEVSPSYDIGDTTSLAAAMICAEMLCLLASRKR